ncbi:MAG: VUT family protein [Bacteroidetes bacterium]|nr:MAG: VUT family protein [Bacteroidota bacterium]
MSKQDKRQKLFLVLGAFFLCNALIAEFIGVKIFSAEATLGLKPFEIPVFGQTYSFNMTAGVLLWPVVFVFTDIINEYFGKKGVRFFSWLTAGLIAYAYLMVLLAMNTESADFWKVKETTSGPLNMDMAFNAIFGQGLWIILGSLIAFLFGQLVDVFVFHALKKKTGEGNIWLRATGSTLVSQLFDSFIVLFIAFYVGNRINANLSETAPNPWSMELVLSICWVNYIYKAVMAIVMTPVLYGVHYLIDRFLGKELAESMKREAHLGYEEAAITKA